MNRSCLNFNEPIRDAVSRIQFAPASNNLLISSWDSILRLYDVDKCELRLEAPTEGALLDCCFESESVAISSGSDGSVLRYDMHLGTNSAIGIHDDLATCVEYSEETRKKWYADTKLTTLAIRLRREPNPCQIISAGWDKNLKFWDARSSRPIKCLSNVGLEVKSMSLSGFNLMVAFRSSIYVYDLRNFNESIQYMDIHIKCVRSISNVEGFAVGSVDGRVALKYLSESNSKNEGYAFRCHPKDKNGRHHLVAVNDIAFNPSVYGLFVTGDNEGYATIWDAQSKKRLLELPKYPNSVASLAYNHDGQLLAVASGYTYQESNEREEPPQIFMHNMDDGLIRSASASSSKRK